jgi:hypothetical protein
LREQLAERLGMPVSLSAGPRYLRNFEQAYKGGPSKGLFLILTAEPAWDLNVPGAGYTFGQLQLALALNDFQSFGVAAKPGHAIAVHSGIGAGLGRTRATGQETLALGQKPSAMFRNSTTPLKDYQFNTYGKAISSGKTRLLDDSCKN